MTKIGFFLVTIAGLLGIWTNLYAAQINFVPELTLTEEYTDNLFLVSDEVEKIDDLITRIGLGLSLNVLGRASGIELNYTPSYNKFADNDDLDFWRHSASLHTWSNVTRRTLIDFTSTFLESEDPRDTSDDIPPEGSVEGPAIGIDRTRRTRNKYRRSRNELNLSYQFGARNTLSTGLAYNINREVDVPAGAEVSDLDELRPSAGVEVWLGRDWRFIVDGTVSYRDYVDRDDRIEYDGSIRGNRNFSRRFSGYVQYRHTIMDFDQETDSQDYVVYAPSLGIEYQLGENSSLSVGAGYYIQEFDDGQDDSQPFVEAEISHRWAFRTSYIRLTASSGYDIEDTGAQELGLQIYYDALVQAGYNFSPRFSGDIYAGYRYDDYPNQEPTRSDKRITSGAGLSYQAIRWMRFRLTYNFSDVQSDNVTDEYTENSVLLTITIVPSSPFRLN